MTTPLEFSYDSPTRVQFGSGSHRTIVAALPECARRVLLVRGAKAATSAPVLACLTDAGIETTEHACVGEPTVPSIDAALAILSETTVDAVIVCGGGAAIDTGKTIRFALAHGLRTYDDFSKLTPDTMARPCTVPCIVMPTTAGTGAEVTSNAVIGVPDKQAKISLRGRGLYPDLAIIDPDLMKSAPASIALYSGLDAVTQIFESHTSNAATPFSLALTSSVKEMGLPALRRIIEEDDQTAWPDLAWVAHVSGLALANSGLGAAHGLASVIGGQYDAPHGAICGRLLIPVLRQNLLRAQDGTVVHKRITSCVSDIRHAFPATSDNDPFSGFATWLDANGLPHLSDWAVRPNDLTDLAHKGMNASSSQKNAVNLKHKDYVRILETSL